MLPDKPSDNRTEAPFNLGLDTLQRIASIVDKIGATSLQIFYPVDLATGQPSEAGEVLRLKFALVQQLYVQSFALLSEEERKAVEQNLNVIKLPNMCASVDQYGYTKIKWPFSPLANQQLDFIELQIQKYLALKGYFMPNRNDPKQIWRQQT